MSEEIKPRHIRELRNLPISEMTDEEIVKASMDRLKANCAMLVYDDGQTLAFFGRYNAAGRITLMNLRKVCETVFGKFHAIKDEDDQ
jgi:hypothetical protein